VLLDVGFALTGERIDTPARAFFSRDQSLILKLLERWVDRPRARVPHALTSLLQFLHDLVTVARLFFEERKDGRTNVAAFRARASAERVPAKATRTESMRAEGTEPTATVAGTTGAEATRTEGSATATAAGATAGRATRTATAKEKRGRARIIFEGVRIVAVVINVSHVVSIVSG
jgi:hypothetical protein